MVLQREQHKMEKKYPKIIRGALLMGRRRSPPPCQPGTPPNPHTPVEALEGIQKDGSKKISRTEIETTDLICEGPIQGLVSGKYNFVGTAGNIGWNSYSFSQFPSRDNNPYLRSVYWRNIPVIDDAGNYNYSQINFNYSYGTQTVPFKLNSNISNQSSVNSVSQSSRTLSIGDVLRYGSSFTKQYDLRSSNIKSIIISIKIDLLYDQQNDPNRDKQSFNLGCGQSVEMSQTVGDIRDRSLSYNFKIYKMTKNGLILIVNQNQSSSGKITSGFIDKFTFDLSNTNPDEEGFLGYRVRIERTSPESTVINLKDNASIHSITEIFREEYVYPKVATFKSLFTAEYFGETPSRTYEVDLLKVKIPSNYDPIKKTYDGDWDGRFSDEYHPSGNGLYWTDNPVWCYYDLLTNSRYGLGKYIPSANVDKWNLFQIAQYCDTLVNDGFGNVEPRFTCNAIINDFSDAYSMLNDFASIFRGMSYYANGSIYAISDMPKEPYILFTNSNVENGDFNYTSSSRKTRNTVATIRYNDIGNFSKPTIEYVEDSDGIRKYGIRKIEINAFGCTSRGQAYRLGKWALASQQAETETIEFTAGLDSLYLRPGDIIKVQDENRSLKRLGGRILEISTGNNIHSFVLDEEYSNITGYFGQYYPNDASYKLEILTPTYRVTGNKYSDFLTGYNRPEIQSGFFNLNLNRLSGVSGYNPNPDKILAKINCNKLFDNINYEILTGATWTAQSTGSAASFYVNTETELYRVIGITEIEKNKYSINGLEYNPSKYLFIESGISSSNPPPIVTPTAKLPSFSTGVQIYTGSDQLYVNYRISGASDTAASETSAWFVYLKTGVDFVAGDLENKPISDSAFGLAPKNEFLIDNLSHNDITNDVVSGDYLPSGNTNLYFRIYGVNTRGYYNISYTAGNPNPFNYQSVLLSDYTNLIELNAFKYYTINDSIQSVGLNLPSGNLFKSSLINFQWELNNLAPQLKEWNNDNITYRLLFGTGNFSPSLALANSIKTEYLKLGNNVGLYNAYTGISSSTLTGILSTNTMSGFWLAIDASGTNSSKYSSQETQASQNYTRPLGYLFGEFNNNVPIVNRFTNLNNTSLSLGADGNLTMLSESPPDAGSAFVFLTDNVSKTGYLSESNINKILSQQFTAPYTGFVSNLLNSGIQLRELFYLGANRYATNLGFNPTIETVIKTGYLVIRFASDLQTQLTNQFTKDFDDGSNDSIYNPQNYPSSAPNEVFYGSYPVGISKNYRWPSNINSSRQIANNLMFLKQTDDFGRPYAIGNSAGTPSIDDLSGVINNLISLSGDAFLKNKNNIGNLNVSGNINLSGRLFMTGAVGTLFFGRSQVSNSTTATYAPSGYLGITINGSGVRIPYFSPGA